MSLSAETTGGVLDELLKKLGQHIGLYMGADALFRLDASLTRDETGEPGEDGLIPLQVRRLDLSITEAIDLGFVSLEEHTMPCFVFMSFIQEERQDSAQQTQVTRFPAWRAMRFAVRVSVPTPDFIDYSAELYKTDQQAVLARAVFLAEKHAGTYTFDPAPGGRVCQPSWQGVFPEPDPYGAFLSRRIDYLWLVDHKTYTDYAESLS